MSGESHFGFARIPFFGRRFWFVCMLLTMMLPAQVQIIPQYIVFSELGWINTFLPLIVPKFFGQAFFIFLMLPAFILFLLFQRYLVQGISTTGLKG